MQRDDPVGGEGSEAPFCLQTGGVVIALVVIVIVVAGYFLFFRG